MSGKQWESQGCTPRNTKLHKKKIKIDFSHLDLVLLLWCTVRKCLYTIGSARTRTMTLTSTTIPIRGKVDAVVGRRYEAICLNTLRHHPGLEIEYSDFQGQEVGGREGDSQIELK